MALLREKEILLKASKSKILLLPSNNYSEQSEQLERTNSLSVYHYISPESSNTDILNSASQNNRLSDLDFLLFTLTITRRRI